MGRLAGGDGRGAPGMPCALRFRLPMVLLRVLPLVFGWAPRLAAMREAALKAGLVKGFLLTMLGSDMAAATAAAVEALVPLIKLFMPLFMLLRRLTR